MALSEQVQVVVAAAGVFASAMAAVDRRLIKRLRREGATAAEAATPLAGLGRIGRWRLSRLRASGAVAAGDDGRVYLNEAAYTERRQRRRKAAIAIVLTGIVAFAVWYLAG